MGSSLPLTLIDSLRIGIGPGTAHGEKCEAMQKGNAIEVKALVKQLRDGGIWGTYSTFKLNRCFKIIFHQTQQNIGGKEKR